MGPRTGLDGCGRSRPTGIRSPDRPARSESLLEFLGVNENVVLTPILKKYDRRMLSGFIQLRIGTSDELFVR